MFLSIHKTKFEIKAKVLLSIRKEDLEVYKKITQPLNNI